MLDYLSSAHGPTPVLPLSLRTPIFDKDDTEPDGDEEVFYAPTSSTNPTIALSFSSPSPMSDHSACSP